MIKQSHVNVYHLDAAKIIEEELPNLNLFYNSGDELHADVHWLLGEFIDNRNKLPIVEITETAGDRLVAESTQHYKMMLAGLAQLFEEDNATILKYMDSSATKLPGFMNFIDYAKHSFKSKDQAIYGRYDMAIDENGGLRGMYEFNGDTPVMLFESINLQNAVSESIYEAEAQLNEWWPTTVKAFSHTAGKTVAVVCALNAVEDLSTTETIMQVFDTIGASPYLCNIADLNHDVLHLTKPFEITNVRNRADYIFLLLPWEEMIESGHDILVHWRSWANHVKFLEPAWRWFMSNKGFMAYLTNLLENDPAFKTKWAGVKHIPTYLEKPAGGEYVKKPKLGRLGQNIEVHSAGSVTSTEGGYADEVCVFQPLVPTTKFGDDGKSLLATGWIADGSVKTIAFRVFGGTVTNLNDEQWIAHRIAFD